MKKIAIGFVCMFTLGTAAMAQDFKKAKNAYTISLLPGAAPAKLEEAKTEVDKLITDAKAQSKPETWLLKAQIYASLSANQTLAEKYPNADIEGLTALKKYLELEPSEQKLKEEGYAGINEIYTSLFNAGVKHYNAQNWEASHDKFKHMAEFGDMLIQRKWSNSSFDTTAYLYAGATAQNAKKDEDAARYFAGLANLKVGGKDYESIYEYLTKYYLRNKNEQEFNKYLALAKEVYPTNKMWKELEFYYIAENLPLEEIAKRFDADNAAGKLDAGTYFEYGNFFAADQKIRDLDEKARAPYAQRALQAFQKAYELDNTNGLAAYNAGVTLYELYETAYDNARKIKGTTADIKAKQAEANKIVDAHADKAMEWIEKAFNTLQAKEDRSNLERSTLNKTVDVLYNLANYKRDRSRGVNVKDYDKYDALMKKYDALHNKF